MTDVTVVTVEPPGEISSTKDSLTKESLTVNRIISMAPFVNYYYFSKDATTSDILEALSTMKPFPTAITWMCHAISSSTDINDWYFTLPGPDESKPVRLHYIAINPDYADIYALAGGDMNMPVMIGGDVNLSVLHSTKPIHEIDVAESWNKYPDYVVLMALSEGLDPEHHESVLTLKAKYLMTPLPMDTLVLDAVCDTLRNARNVLSEVDYETILEGRDEFFNEFIYHVATHDHDINRTIELLELHNFSNECDLMCDSLRKHGVKSRLHICHPEAIQYLMGIPTEVNMSQGIMWKLTETILDDPKSHHDRIIEINKHRVKNLQDSLPWQTAIPEDDDPLYSYLPHDILIQEDNGVIRIMKRTTPFTVNDLAMLTKSMALEVYSRVAILPDPMPVLDIIDLMCSVDYHCRIRDAKVKIENDIKTVEDVHDVGSKVLAKTLSPDVVGSPSIVE